MTDTDLERKPFDFSLAVIFFIVVYVAVLVQTAWMGDDAFITARSVENFIHGCGPVYNVDERVQTFTHPLWFFVISAPYYVIVQLLHLDVYGQYYYLVMGISFLFSIATVVLFATRIAKSHLMAILGITVLILSQAFMDFSTGGLESPLTHFFIVLFLWGYFDEQWGKKHRLFWLTFLASLAAVNRLDTILFFLPALVYAFIRAGGGIRIRVQEMFFGSLPLLLWEIFSVVYYGFPFPNTAYAKLNTGISAVRLIQQGVYYFLNSLDTDPLTLVVIGGTVLIAISSKERRYWEVLLGVGLYLLYTLKIGGDFMSGRFFAAPLLISISYLANRFAFADKGMYALMLAMLFAVGISGSYPPLLTDRNYGTGVNDASEWITTQGIANERAYYYQQTGLLTDTRYKIFYESPFSGVGWNCQPSISITKVVVVGGAGWAGYVQGPEKHVIDRNALVDPLMARLPVEDVHFWRIGHFHHILPDGYVETLESGENHFDNPNLWHYYQKIRVVVSGPLFSRQRWIAIWELNTGRLDYLLHAYVQEYRAQH